MTAVGNGLLDWFSLRVPEAKEGEHIFFRYILSRKFGVTLSINNQLNFVSIENNTVTHMDLNTVQKDGGTLCRVAYGITDSLPRVNGVATYVLHDTPANVTRRLRKALDATNVHTDTSTWAVSICASFVQGSRIYVGDHQHGVVFDIDDEYRVYTVMNGRVRRYPLWEFLANGQVEKLNYVDNTPLQHITQDEVIDFCEYAMEKGEKWSVTKYNSRQFCSALRFGSLRRPPPAVPPPPTVDQILIEQHQKLEELASRMSRVVGQSLVKTALKEILCVHYSNKIFIAGGLPTLPILSINECFVGPPGTGKAATASVLTRVLHWAGRLPTDKFTCVSGADLIGEYAGHTERKIREVVTEAAGGLLFIGEAHMISSNTQYGNVCIAELMLLMQRHEHNTAFVMAGHNDDIENLLNLGFAQHFLRTLVFKPLSVNEIAQCVELKLRDHNLIVPASINLVNILLTCASEVERLELNGKLADRVVKQVRKNYGNRLIDAGVVGDGGGLEERDFAMPPVDPHIATEN